MLVAKLAVSLPQLDERQRRLLLGPRSARWDMTGSPGWRPRPGVAADGDPRGDRGAGRRGRLAQSRPSRGLCHCGQAPTGGRLGAAVADAPHRDDEVRPELAAKVANVDVHNVGGRVEVVTPHTREQLLAAQDLPWVAQEGFGE